MNKNGRIALIATFLLLTASGAADVWIRRSRDKSSALKSGVVALDQIPARIGNWEGAETALDPIIVRVAGCAGYRNLRYTHSLTGRAVDVTLMVGQPGQMAEHVPEVCYPAGGYSLIQSSFSRRGTVVLAPGIDGELAVMDFLNPRLGDSRVRVWHGWYDGKRWSRPENPRFAFVTATSLLRLQVWSTLVPDPLAEDENKLIDAGEEFLRDALPEITNRFPAPARDRS